MIKTTIEKMTCCACDKDVPVSIMTDVDDDESPELLQVPTGAFVTSLPLDDGEDGWFVACSSTCATTFVEEECEEADDEPEIDDDPSIEEKH